MAKDRPKIGAHLRTSDPLVGAESTGSELVQLFLSNPQGWKKPAPHPDAEALKASPMPVYVHAPYLVNLAASNPRVRHPSRKILRETCEAAVTVGATAVIVHGGHVDGEDSIEAGAERWAKALAELDSEVPVYLENTAGGDHAMARRFDALAVLWDHIGDMGIGFCLDTCHAHAAGEELVDAAERILAITGRIDLVHANDSRDEFGSGADRHEHLGLGTIDPQAIVEIVRTAGAPVICETSVDGVKDDIAFLRESV